MHMVDAERIALIISRVISFPFMALIGVVAFSFFRTQTGTALSSASIFTLGLIFLSILPIAPVLYYAHKGKVDLDVSNRGMRPLFLAYACVVYVFSALLFYFLGAYEMTVFSLAYLSSTVVTLIVTIKWKISVHASAVAIPASALTYIYGLPALVVFLLLAPIAWARVHLKAHTPMQVIAGAVLSTVVTFSVFLCLY